MSQISVLGGPKTYFSELSVYTREAASVLGRTLLQFLATLKSVMLEREIRFAKLHERRAETIDELYRLLVETEQSIECLLTPEAPDEEGIWLALENAFILSQFFATHRIYFTSSLCDKMAKFQRAWMILVRQFPPDSRAPDITLSKKSLSEIGQKIPEIRREIESDFRRMLGVS